jgi:hypothetical protein
MRTPVDIIGDGFDERVEPGKRVGNDVDKSSGGNSKPESTPERINGYTAADPTAFIDGGTDGTPRRRGRPRGSRTQTGTETSPDLGSKSIAQLDLEMMLFGLHQMMSTALAPELALDPKECKVLSDAMKELSKFYPNGINPKKVAWFNLTVAMGGIYAPRLGAIYRRSTAAPKPPGKPQAVPTPITQTRTAAGGANATTPAPVATATGGKPWSEMTPSELYNEPPVPDTPNG